MGAIAQEGYNKFTAMYNHLIDKRFPKEQSTVVVNYGLLLYRNYRENLTSAFIDELEYKLECIVYHIDS